MNMLRSNEINESLTAIIGFYPAISLIVTMPCPAVEAYIVAVLYLGRNRVQNSLETQVLSVKHYFEIFRNIISIRAKGRIRSIRNLCLVDCACSYSIVVYLMKEKR